jgi:hypothetical protein
VVRVRGLPDRGRSSVGGRGKTLAVKPVLATRMITRALDAGATAGWVAPMSSAPVKRSCMPARQPAAVSKMSELVSSVSRDCLGGTMGPCDMGGQTFATRPRVTSIFHVPGFSRGSLAA